MFSQTDIPISCTCFLPTLVDFLAVALPLAGGFDGALLMFNFKASVLLLSTIKQFEQ